MKSLHSAAAAVEPSPIRLAVERIGGPAVVAWFLEVDASLVRQWMSKARPLAVWYCPALERLSGVRCESLRPDFCFQRDVNGDATGYVVKFDPLLERFPRLVDTDCAEANAR